MLENITIRQAQIVALLLVAISFGTAIGNGYAWDDEFVTTPEHPIVSKGIAGIPELFVSKYSEVHGKQFGYRPVAAATFAVEYSLFGFAPGISHLINIMLYALLVLLVFKVLRTLFNTHPLWMIFAATLVFAVHPLHNEVVVSLKNREEILAALMGFSAFWAFLKYADSGAKGMAAIGFLAMLAGFFVKVSVYPFVFLIPLILWYLGRTTVRGALTVLGMLMLAGLTYTLIAQQLLDVAMTNREMDHVENPLVHTGFWERVPMAFSVFAHYLKLFVFPHPLLSYYGLGQVPMSGWAQFSAWAGLASAAVLLWVAVREFNRNRLLVIALLFTVVSIAPYLNLLWLAPGIIAERFAFLSVLGFSLAVVWAMEIMSRRSGLGSLNVAVLGVMTVAFVSMNILRNPDWHSKLHLLEVDAAKAPHSVKLQTALAEVYHTMSAQSADQTGRDHFGKKAEEQYLKAIAHYPEHQGAYSNLGVLYAMQQRLEKARQNLEKAIALGHVTADTYYNLGAVYEMSADGKKAVECYRKALALDPLHEGSKARLQELDR